VIPLLATTAQASEADNSLAWIELALVIFMAVFVVIVIGVVLRRKGHFDRAARIPLDDTIQPPTARTNGLEH